MMLLTVVPALDLRGHPSSWRISRQTGKGYPTDNGPMLLSTPGRVIRISSTVRRVMAINNTLAHNRWQMKPYYFSDLSPSAFDVSRHKLVDS